LGVARVAAVAAVAVVNMETEVRKVLVETRAVLTVVAVVVVVHTKEGEFISGPQRHGLSLVSLVR